MRPSTPRRYAARVATRSLARIPARSRRHALALAAAALLAAPASAEGVVVGPWYASPEFQGPLSGPNLLLPQTRLFLGDNGSGGMTANAGSQVQLAGLWVGVKTGEGAVTLDGPGTVMSLHGDGHSPRLEIGNWRTGSLTVRNGAVLNGRADSTSCMVGRRLCHAVVGAAAGSTGQLNVIGAGSEAYFLSSFQVGATYLSNGFGAAGGLTRAGVLVMNGGLLRTEEAVAGLVFGGAFSSGTERVEASLAVVGPNSRWIVDPRTVNEGGNVIGAFVDLAQGPRSTVAFDVVGGGRFEVINSPGGQYGGNLGGRGTFNGLVSGPGSAVVVSGDLDKGYLNLGAGGGHSMLNVNDRALLSTTTQTLNVGFDRGTGTLVVSGQNTRLEAPNSITRVGSGGTGTLRLEGGATGALRILEVGYVWLDSARGNGSVVVDGPGTRLTVSDAAHTRLTAGDWGTGSITVSGGAKLDAPCPAGGCLTIVGHTAGSSGRLTVTGVGSELVSPADLWVGSLKLFTQAVDGFTLGTPGGTTHARVEVLNGGTLRTPWVNVGSQERPETATGGERSFSEMVVSGAGSLWSIATTGARSAEFRTGWSPRASSTLEVSLGGAMRLDSAQGGSAFFLGLQGGSDTATVRDAGSRLDIVGDVAGVIVGRQAGSSRLVVRDGAAMALDGRNSSFFSIGDPGGSGAVAVLSGATVNAGRQVTVGAGGTGSLLVAGAGSVFSLDARGGVVNEIAVAVGAAGSGRLEVTSGGTVSSHRLRVGEPGGVGPGGRVVVDGTGSTLRLDAPDRARLSAWNGELTVSGGARLTDAVGGVVAPCNVGSFCEVALADKAGARSVFTVTDPGSMASLSYNFIMGGSYADSAAQAGLLTRSTLNVLDGATLHTGHAALGIGAGGAFANGAERAEVAVTVSGAGSAWLIGATPGQTWTSLSTGLQPNGGLSGANTSTQLRIDQGGLLRLQGAPTGLAYLGLGETGGTHQLVVHGAGSRLEFTGTPLADLTVGRSGAQSALRVEAGAAVLGARALTLGAGSGTQGRLVIDGAGSLLRLTGTDAVSASASVGMQGGSGSLAITGGGALELRGATFQFLAMGQAGGAFAGSQGSLQVHGAGSRLDYLVPVPTTGSANAALQVGTGGTGSAEVSSGGRVRMAMDGIGAAGNTVSGQLTIGVGSPTTGVTGSGTMTIRGLDSLVDIAMPNSFVTVGQGTGNPNGIGGTGVLNIVSGGELRSTMLRLGHLNNGIGTLAMNAGTVTLGASLANSPAPQNGPFMTVGSNTGSLGTAGLGANSRLILSAPAGSTATLHIASNGGTGVIAVNGGSTVQLNADAGLARASIGRVGSGLATFSGTGTTLSVPGGQVLVGEFTNGMGILRVEDGAEVSAAYIGVGSTPGADGGVGQFIVNGSSIVRATTIEIGARGFVGGSGTLVGNVINRGVFNPGNSPGTMTIDGSFSNAAGGRLVLEVESDGNGGFVTDRLVFAGAVPDLAGVQVSFSFLGDTNPLAFLSAGLFDIGNFLRVGETPLAPALLAGASYSASSSAYQITNFSYSPQAGASFVATPVPEPATWLLWAVAGLAAWRWRQSSA